MSQKGKIIKSLSWKLMERFGVLGGQFVLQILLARILDPGHYGALSLMIIFTSLANVFTQHGLNTALVQNKDVTDDDYSSVFWINMVFVSLMYIVFFFAAPLIAQVYEMPDIVWPFRVLSLMLFPGALNSVQLARVRRKMEFFKSFYCNLAAMLVSGITGIVLAYQGAGLWALVAQSVLNVLVSCIVMWFLVDIHPRFVFNLQRVKVLFSFGWKLMASNLIETLYQDLRSMVIGVKYNADTLGYYNRGKHFPQFVNNAINSSVQSVMLPAMSAEQDDKAKVKNMMRNSVTLSAYIIFPLMAGLAGVATPMVRLLLTDKWLPCVPYLQIYCFSLAFHPVHSCNLQAINAMGRSDVFLKLELIKKLYGVALLVLAMLLIDSPLAIAISGAVGTLISCFVNASPNKKLIGYSYLQQMKDILPSFLLSLFMCGCVLAVGMLQLPNIILLILQVITGIAVYVGVSALLGLKPFHMLLKTLKKTLRKAK